MKYSKNSAQRGFTLIELSIVLVIIGLIVGGVLVGQDLIKGAEIRATISQIEKYNAAANTFRLKYGGVPGDTSNAANFGLPHAADRTGAAGLSNGDRLLTSGCTGAATTNVGCGEIAMFWNDLASTNLISDGTTASTVELPGADITGANIASWIPQAKLGGGAYFVVGSNSGLNYFLLTGITNIQSAAGFYGLQFVLSPMVANQIDSKLDDGRPDSGIAEASTTIDTDTTGAVTPTLGFCWDTMNNIYFMDDTYRDEPRCALRIRASF